MQPLLAAPRDSLTTGQVTDALVGPALTLTAGCEVLDSTDTVLLDISDDLAGGSVARDNYADVHGTCRLLVSRPLAWGAVRVRPYVLVNTVRFNLGVYVLTTPVRPIGLTPATYEVDGYDKLYLLRQPIGDTYTVAAGTAVLQAVADAITASAVGGSVLLDQSAAAKTLTADKVWPLDENSQPTWLDVINDLLSSVGYRGLWADWNGALRSEPYIAPSSRAPEWTFDTGGLTVMSADRTETYDVWGVPNWWRFIARGWTSVSEGSGQYTVENTADGPTSVDALGRRVRKVSFVDAADQASLVAQATQTVTADRQVSRTVTLKTAPFPLCWHFDVCTVSDPAFGADVQAQGRSWSLPFDGTDMDHTWEVVA